MIDYLVNLAGNFVSKKKSYQFHKQINMIKLPKIDA